MDKSDGRLDIDPWLPIHHRRNVDGACRVVSPPTERPHMRKITVTVLLSLVAVSVLAAAPSDVRAEKNQWLAGGLNFFFPGAGYMYNGDKPLYVTAPILAGSLGLAYVEQIHEFDDGNTLLEHDSTAFGVMFAAIFIANTGFAIDAYQEAGRINKREKATETSLHFDLRPMKSSSGDQGFGLSLSGGF